MSSFWQVAPETVQREGEWRGRKFWVQLAKQLSHGEQMKMHTSAFKSMRRPTTVKPGERDDDARIDVDFGQLAIGRILAYVKDWSLSDDGGKALKVTRETVESLHPELVEAINALINEHEEEIGAEKKATTGSPGLNTMSA